MFKFHRKLLSFENYNLIYTAWTVFGVYNFYFWRQVFAVVTLPVFFFLLLGAFLLMMILHALVFHPKTVKPLSILLLLTNALASYFINMYHLVLNKTMLANVLDTNFVEATEWMGVAFWMYILAFGVIPAWLVLRLNIQFSSIKKRCLTVVVPMVCLIMLLSIFIPYKDTVKVALKTHFNLRYQFVPTGYVSACVSLVKYSFKKGMTLLGPVVL